MKGKRLVPLRSVVGEKRFFAVNGDVYGNMADLAEGLRAIGLQAFSYHVTLEKNDFAVWLRDCFGEVDLARALELAKSPHSMVLKISRHLERATER